MPYMTDCCQPLLQTLCQLGRCLMGRSRVAAAVLAASVGRTALPAGCLATRRRRWPRSAGWHVVLRRLSLVT